MISNLANIINLMTASNTSIRIGSSEETVALFMKNLEASEFFTGVELKVTKQKVQDRIKFHEFELSCRTVKNKAKSKKGKK